MRTSLLIVALGVCLTSLVTAQQQTGPTMEETAAWLASDGKDLMRGVRLQDDKVHLSIYHAEEQVDSISLTSCTLIWRTIATSHTTTFSRGRQDGPTTTRTTDVTLSLRDITVGSVNVESDTLLTDKPMAVVRLAPRQSTESTSFTSIDFGNPVGIRFATLPVQGPEDAQRVANAIKHAITLCGGGKASLF